MGKPLADIPIPRLDKYAPVTRNRMAFLIVFDASDEDSFAQAKQAHTDLEMFIQLKKIHFRPVVYLVANKIDRGTKAVSAAKEYAEAKKEMLRPIVEVSALEVRKVKRLFHDMLNDVRNNPILWKLTWQDDDEMPGQTPRTTPLGVS